MNVPGVEQVITPAGSFKAYKLVMDQSWTVPEGEERARTLRQYDTYFYSPETRSIVKRITDGERDSQVSNC